MDPLTALFIFGGGFFLSFVLMFAANRQRGHPWRILLYSSLAIAALIGQHIFCKRAFDIGHLFSDPKVSGADIIVGFLCFAFVIWTALLLIACRKLPYETDRNA